MSVTGPGANWLPWDGDTGRVVPAIARHWNASAPARWSGLHREAARAARREAARHGATWRLLMGAWEYQKRGILHRHLVVPMGSPAEVAASEAYVSVLDARRKAWWFGFVDRGRLPGKGARRSTRRLSPTPPHRAASYVASYLASTGAGKGGIAEVAKAQGVPGPVLYVSATLSRASGVTMRSLKNRRRVACQWPGAAGSAESWRAACVLDALGRGRPPIAPDERGALMQAAMAQRWSHTYDRATGEVRGATSAPLPSVKSPAGSTPTRAETWAPVRLDSVLHRGHAAAPARWTTRVVCG